MVDLGSTVKPIKEICSWQKRHFIQYSVVVRIIYRVLFLGILVKAWLSTLATLLFW